MNTIFGDYFSEEIEIRWKCWDFAAITAAMQEMHFSNGTGRRKLTLGRKIKKGDATMNLRTHFHRWMQYRENVRELSGCTDRELSDLGLSRTDIHRVAREAAFA